MTVAERCTVLQSVAGVAPPSLTHPPKQAQRCNGGHFGTMKPCDDFEDAALAPTSKNLS